MVQGTDDDPNAVDAQSIILIMHLSRKKFVPLWHKRRTKSVLIVAGPQLDGCDQMLRMKPGIRTEWFGAERERNAWFV